MRDVYPLGLEGSYLIHRQHLLNYTNNILKKCDIKNFQTMKITSVMYKVESNFSDEKI